MADRVEILMRARGGTQVAGQTRTVSRGFTAMGRSATLANKAAGRLTTGLGGLATWGKRAGLAVGGAAIIEIKRGTQAWEDHRKTAKELRTDLKRTGGQANVTAKGIYKMANAMQARAAVDDDAVAKGAALLLTFKAVRNEQGKGNAIFNRTTKAAVDLSAKFDQGLKPSMIQLGKALQDPTKGILALRRSGISFSKSQIETIKRLDETGQSLKAQKLILREVESQVKGTARAQATPLAKLKQSWGDLEKELGRAVAPTIDKVSGKIQRLVDDASKIMGRRNLTWTAKLKLFSQRDLEPQAQALLRGLKRANLDEKLASAVEWAIPKMANGFAAGAPRAASAFVKGFQGAGTWGKLLTVAFIAKKLGGFGAMGRLLAGGFGKGLGGKGGGIKDGLLGRGGPGNPMFVTVTNDVPGAPGSRGGNPGKPGKGGKILNTVKGAAPFLPVVGLGAYLGTEAYKAGASNWVGTPKRETLKTGDLTGALNKLSAKLTGVGKGRPAGPQGARGATWINPKLIASSLGTATRNATRDLPGKTGKAVRDGTKPLDKLPQLAGRAIRDNTKDLQRLPEKVAGAVARRPNNVRIHNVIQMPDGRVLAEIVTDYPELLAGAVGRERGRNRERG